MSMSQYHLQWQLYTLNSIHFNSNSCYDVVDNMNKTCLIKRYIDYKNYTKIM